MTAAPAAGAVGPEQGEFRANWAALVAAFCGIAFGIASMFLYSQGLFIKEIQAEFGWSRTAISIAFLVGALTCALLAPFAGGLVDRYGARLVGCSGLVALALYFALIGGFHGSYGLFVAMNVVLAALSAGSSPVTFARLVTHHFARNRGLALGIALSATGVTAALLPALIGPVIVAHGWRMGYLAMAAIVLLAAPLVLIFGRAPASRVEAGRVDLAQDGATLGAALRTPAFWLFLASFALSALAVGGFIVHFIPLLTDGGLSVAEAGGLAALIGVSVVAGRLLTGFAIDRLPGTLVGAVVFLLAAAGCAVLALGPISMAMVAALCVGVAMGAEGDVASFLVARHFGTRHYGKIYGVIYGVLVAGITASPTLYALLFDQTGGYRWALLASAAILTASSALLVAVPRTPAASRRANLR